LLQNNSKGELDELLAVMGLGFQEYGNEMIPLLFIMHILLRAWMDVMGVVWSLCFLQPFMGETKFQTPLYWLGLPKEVENMHKLAKKQRFRVLQTFSPKKF
jgi:hypothetical protein